MMPETSNSTQRIELTLQPPPARPSESIGELAPYFAWPIAACLIAFILRGALSSLLQRATKVSVGLVALELPGASAKPLTIESVDELRDTGASAGDSSRQLSSALLAEEQADYVRVDLGLGQAWLTSRLYLLAVLAPRMRGVSTILFEGGTDSASTAIPGAMRQLIGVADIERVAWALSREYPWLEIAFAKAYADAALQFAAEAPTASKLTWPLGPAGRLSINHAQAIILNFKTVLQVWLPGIPASVADESWTALAQYWERGSWISESVLKHLLQEHIVTSAVVRDLKTPDDEIARQVLRATTQFVPIVNHQREFLAVRNRQKLLNKVAKIVADEA